MPFTGGYGGEQELDVTRKVEALQSYLPELDPSSLLEMASSGADLPTLLSNADKMVNLAEINQGVTNLKAMPVERQAAEWNQMNEVRRSLYTSQGYVAPDVQRRQEDTDKAWWQTGLEALGFVPSKMKDVVVGAVSTGAEALGNATDAVAGRPWRAVHQMSQDEQFATHGVNLTRARYDMEKEGIALTDDEWRAVFSRYQERNPHTYEGGFLSGASDRINPNPWSAFSGRPVDEELYRKFEQRVYAIESEADHKLADWGSAWGRTATGDEYVPPSVEIAAMDLMSEGMARYSEGFEFARYKAIGKSADEFIVDKLGVDPNDTARIEAERQRLGQTYVGDQNWKAGYKLMADNANRITMGRDMADSIGLQRDTASYTLTSGGVDALMALSLDPTMYAGAAVKTMRGGKAAVELTKGLGSIDEIERGARLFKAAEEGTALREGVEFAADKVAMLGDVRLHTSGDLRPLAEVLQPHLDQAGLDKIGLLWDDTGKATPYLRDNYEKVKQVVDAAFDDASEAYTKGDYLRFTEIDVLADTKEMLDASTLVTTDPQRLSLLDRAKAKQQAASYRFNERIAQAFRDMRGADAGDWLTHLGSLYRDLPHTVGATDKLLDYDRFLTHTRGYGIDSAEDIYQWYRTEAGFSALVEGKLWGSAIKPGVVQVPTMSKGTVASRKVINAGSDLIDRLRMTGTMAEARGLKVQELQALGLWGKAEEARKGLRWQLGRPGRATGKFVYSLTHHVPESTFIDLASDEATTMFQKFVGAGAFADMDGALIRRYVDEFAKDTSIAGRRQVVKSFYNDMFMRLGAFDDPDVAEKFSDVISRITNHRYAPNDMDIIKVGSQERRVAVLPTGQESTGLEMLDFREIAQVAHDLGFMNKAFGAVNNRTVDAFMSRVWKPSLLLRMGFVPRTAGEEVMTHISRFGFKDGFRSYLGQKAASDVSLGDWLARWTSYKRLGGSMTRNEAREVLQWKHALEWEDWRSWMAKEVRDNLGREAKVGDKFAFFADYWAARMTKRIKNLELLAAPEEARLAAVVGAAGRGYDIEKDAAGLYKTYAEHANDLSRTLEEVLAYSAHYQDTHAKLSAARHGLYDGGSAAEGVRTLRVAKSRSEATSGERQQFLLLKTDGTIKEGAIEDFTPEEVINGLAWEYTTLQNAPAARRVLSEARGVLTHDQAVDAARLLNVPEGGANVGRVDEFPLRQPHPVTSDWETGRLNTNIGMVEADWKAGMASVRDSLVTNGIDPSRLADALKTKKGYRKFLEARESARIRLGYGNAAEIADPARAAQVEARATTDALDALGIEWDTVALRRQSPLDLTTYNPGEALMTDEQRAERMAREAVGPVPPMTREEFKAGRAEFQAAAKARIEEIEQTIGELDFGRPPRKHTRTDRITGQKKKVRGFKDAGGFRGAVGWDGLNGLSDEDEAYIVKLLGGYADTPSTAGDPSSAISSIEGLRTKGNSWAGVLPAIDEATTGDDMVVLLMDLADEHRALRQALGEIDGSADIKLVRRALPYEDERHFAAFMSERQPRGKRRMVRDENGNAVLSPEGKRQFKSEPSGAAPPLTYEERIALHRENLGSINDEFVDREKQRILGEGLDPVEDDLTALSDDELRKVTDAYGITPGKDRDETIAAIRQASLANPEPLPTAKIEVPWEARTYHPEDGMAALREREAAFGALPKDMQRAFYVALDGTKSSGWRATAADKADEWVLKEVSSRKLKLGDTLERAMLDGDPGNEAERAVRAILNGSATKAEAQARLSLLDDLLHLPRDTAHAVISPRGIRIGDPAEAMRRAARRVYLDPDTLGEGLYGRVQEMDRLRFVGSTGTPVAHPPAPGDRPFYGLMADQDDIDQLGEMVNSIGVDGMIAKIKAHGDSPHVTLTMSPREEQMLARMLTEWDTYYQGLMHQGRQAVAGGSMRPVTKFATSNPDDSEKLAYYLNVLLDPTDAGMTDGLGRVRSSYAYVHGFDGLDDAGRAMVGEGIEDVPGLYRMADHQQLKQAPRDRYQEVRYNDLGDIDENGMHVGYGGTLEEAADDAAALLAEYLADRVLHNGRVMHDIVEPVARGEFHAGVLSGRAMKDMPSRIITPSMYAEKGDNFLGRAIKYGFESILGPASDSMARTQIFTHNLAIAMKAAEPLDGVLRNEELWQAGLDAASKAGLDADGLRRLWRNLGEHRPDVASPEDLREALNEMARTLGDVSDVADPAVLKRLDEIKAERQGLDKRVWEWDEDLTPADYEHAAALAAEEDQLRSAWMVQVDHPIADLSDEDAKAVLAALRHDDHVREQVVRTAYKRAYNDTIPFIDDHHVRSFFQVYARNLMPFQFAQEQFLKRWARAIMYDPAAIERARLLTHGVESSAFIHEDPTTKEKRFVVPFSEAFTGLIPKVLSVFGVEAEIPMGVPLTFDVNNVLAGGPRDLTKVPSMSPMLMLPMQWAANTYPEFRKSVAKPLLGEMGGTTDNSLLESFMPAWAANVYRGIAAGEDAERELTQTTIGAMKMMRAEGIRLRQEGDALSAEGKTEEAQAKYARARELDPPDDGTVTPAEHQLYLDHLRTWSRTIAISKGVFGFFSPGSPREQMGDIEAAPEFRELLAYHPYDEALAMYLADNPDAQPYTIFSTQKDSDAPLPATEEALKWVGANRDFLEAFPKAAPWLMPQQRSADDFSMDAYNDELAIGLRRIKTPEEFYADMKVAAASTDYFDTQEEVNFLKEQYADDKGYVKQLTEWWQWWSTAYRNTHPLFAENLATTGGGGKAEVIDELELALADPGLPDDPRADRMREAIGAFRSYEQAMAGLKGDSRKGAKEQREEWRNWLVDYGDSLMAESPELTTMWRNLIEQEAGVRSVRVNRKLRNEMQMQEAA